MPPSKRRLSSAISTRPAKKVKLTHGDCVSAQSTDPTAATNSATPTSASSDRTPNFFAKLMSFFGFSSTSTEVKDADPLPPSTVANEQCDASTVEYEDPLPPIFAVDWLDEFAAALKTTEPFTDRDNLSLQLIDLCPYSGDADRRRWRTSGRVGENAHRNTVAVVDELGQHYRVGYYAREDQQQAQHEIHMNQLLHEHNVPHVITAVCHVTLPASGVTCIVSPHHVRALTLQDYYRGSPPFKLTPRDLKQGLHDLLSTLQSVRWNTEDRWHTQPLEFCFGRSVSDSAVMLVPNDQTGRVEFKLFKFVESCARLHDRVYAAPCLDWKSVPYTQFPGFLLGLEMVAETLEDSEEILSLLEATDADALEYDQ